MKVQSITGTNYLAPQNQKQINKNTAMDYPVYNYVSLKGFPSNYNCKITNIFEDYNAAEKIFKNNLENGNGIFGPDENVDEIIQNDKIRRNVVKFLAKHSEDELKKLDSKKVLTIEDAQYKSALNEVKNFFTEYEDAWAKNDELFGADDINKPKNIAFAGNITYEQEKTCKAIVHAFSAACGLTSAAFGEGAAIGADTIALRALQLTMFSIMASYLKVPTIASAEYYIKEMCAGAALGVGGAKLVTSWLGIGGHAVSVTTGTTAVTGGGADVAISGGVRAVNATLSTLITEKMGRGYINRVKADTMNWKNQTIEAAGYFFARGILTSDNIIEDMLGIDFKDPSAPELIKDAFNKIPKESVEAIGSVLNTTKKLTSKTSRMFLVNFVGDLFSSKDTKNLKQRAGAVFKNTLLQTMMYEICDNAMDKTISTQAAEKVLQIQKNLDKYPEVYHAVINAEHEFFEKINIDKLDYKAFTKQFKNTTFIYNLSNFCTTAVGEVKTAVENSERSKKASDVLKNPKYTSEEIGFNKIIGHQQLKSILTKKFITPLNRQKSIFAPSMPNAILLYGPKGVNKGSLAYILAEQGGCQVPKFNDDVDNPEELKKELDNIKNKARSADKHTAVIIEDFEDFGSDPDAAKVFADFIKDCAKNKITLLLTSNNPLNIKSNILKQTLNIPIGPASKKDISEVLKYCLKDLQALDYFIIANALDDKTNENSFSVVQIIDMCIEAVKDAKTNDTNPRKNMVKLIKSATPEIGKYYIDKFNDEKTKIQEINL